MASSVITVAGTVFSISIVVLTLASSQFGPRLLRNFIRDPGNQIVLGTFIGTFIYCLLVLRTVRRQEDILFVPHISVTVGVVLALASIGMLIYYIHHVSVSIQAPQIVAAVGRSLYANVDALFPRRLGRDQQDRRVQHLDQNIPPCFEREARPIIGAANGYVTSIDTEGLMETATKRGLILRLVHRPGDFVVHGNTLVLAWPAERVDEKVMQDIAATFVFGTQRTAFQDIEFLFNELVEMAIRALSPAINDPFTAMACIDWLGAALCRLADSEIPSPYRYDHHDKLRVIADPVTFPYAVDNAFNHIREYGRSSTAVTIRLLQTLALLAGRVDNAADAAALLRQAVMIERGSHEGLGEAEDRRNVERHYQLVEEALQHLSAGSVA